MSHHLLRTMFMGYGLAFIIAAMAFWAGFGLLFCAAVVWIGGAFCTLGVAAARAQSASARSETMGIGNGAGHGADADRLAWELDRLADTPPTMQGGARKRG